MKRFLAENIVNSLGCCKEQNSAKYQDLFKDGLHSRLVTMESLTIV